MKIYGNQPEFIQKTEGQETSKTQDTTSASTPFSHFLEKASGTGETKASGHVNSMGSVKPNGLTEIQSQALSYSEETLSMLEHYGTLLNNPETTEETLEQISSNLSQRAEDIKTLRDNLGQEDPLRKTLDAIGIVSAVEALKIKRGDYS